MKWDPLLCKDPGASFLFDPLYREACCLAAGAVGHCGVQRGTVGCRGVLWGAAGTGRHRHPQPLPLLLAACGATPRPTASLASCPTGVCFGAKSFRDERRYPQDFSQLFILRPRCSVAVQLCAEFALGYDVQGSGNEREYFTFEKERDPACSVKFRDLDMEKNACACDEKLPASSSHVTGMRALALCKIMMLVAEGVRKRRGTRRGSPECCLNTACKSQNGPLEIKEMLLIRVGNKAGHT